ncbi:hypothetical protein EVAR_11497_1 [Eumeta japonica]|uniref:Uncharacterized protein n=1 Tax=Eumeta variegata TaxID=151549 RepID=A0A4C1TYP4_EUMVA|nr:hypothetical protein EVAR_11497_1 [Eumeta japonica]
MLTSAIPNTYRTSVPPFTVKIPGFHMHRHPFSCGVKRQRKKKSAIASDCDVNFLYGAKFRAFGAPGAAGGSAADSTFPGIQIQCPYSIMRRSAADVRPPRPDRLT